MAPTIVIVPGFWEGAESFQQLESQLQAAGYPTETLKLPSTGTTSPGNPSMTDDIAAIRQHLTETVNGGKEVLLVLHSAGGFLGSSAIEGLTSKARQGQTGSVTGIVFVTAGISPEGFTHGDLPFAKAEGGSLVPVSPEKLFFNDLSDDKAAEWAGKLHTQPAQDWNGTITYCGWREVPSVYIVCSQDAALPVPLQEQLAGSANSKVETIATGHMPHVSQPEALSKIIVDAAQSLVASA